MSTSQATPTTIKRAYTPLQHTIVDGAIAKIQKVVLLSKGQAHSLALYGVNLDNEVKRVAFDENGEAWFDSFIPVGIWLEFTRAGREIPTFKAVFTGDMLEL